MFDIPASFPFVVFSLRLRHSEYLKSLIGEENLIKRISNYRQLLTILVSYSNTQFRQIRQELSFFLVGVQRNNYQPLQ